MHTQGTPAATAPGAGQFSCPSCGRRYTWKPALAGRSAKCACGAAMLVPLNSPTPDDGLYDLVEPEEHQQAPRHVALPQPPPPVAQVALQYQNPKRVAAEAGDPRFPDRNIDLHLPLILLAAGVTIEIGAAFLSPRSAFGVGGFLGRVQGLGLHLVLGTATMLVGVLVAVRFRGIELGNFWTAVLKLAAVCVAPGALVTLLSPALGVIPFGGLLGFAAEFILYFALLGTLFKLDESDTWYCVCVIFVINVALYFALMAL